MRKGLTQNSRAGNPKRLLPNCQSRAVCSIDATPSSRPGGHPRCGRPADYLPPGAVGQWPPATKQRWIVPKGGDPRTGHLTKGTTRTPDWHPEEKAAHLPQRGTLGIAPRGGAPKTPLREREGTQGPCRRGATCCCRLLRHLLVRYGWTVARVGPFVIFVSLRVKRTVKLTACPVCSEGAR